MDAPRHNGSGHAVTQDTLIAIKITVNDVTKKLKLPLRDLGAAVLPAKLRQVLDVKHEQVMTLERYSDSSAGYITLDPSSPQVFKTLIRAAKAKLKLRLKATITPLEPAVVEEKVTVEQPHLLDEAMPPANVCKDNRPTEALPLSHRSSRLQNATRESTAFDQRSIGSGIFKFRDAHTSQSPLPCALTANEAPVPRPFIDNTSAVLQGPFAAPVDGFATRLAQKQTEPKLPFRPCGTAASTMQRPAWSVYCNECDQPMANEHFHCSICDNGDYDLCEQCVVQGKVCPGEGHWLVKRFIRDGAVVNSTTERILPSKAKRVKSVNLFAMLEPEAQKEMPGSFTDETKTLAEEPRLPTRTCNSCVVVLPEREFVTCTKCDDFDLCIPCHVTARHGHHPAHGFKAATEETVLDLTAESKLGPGRNVRHNAICDGCDKKIYGVRHKCLNCPDWDYCGDCVKGASTKHPRHRFAALYEPISDLVSFPVRHFGIYCDGPLCNKKADQSYISGVRYKCTICHDTDFCANCEALPGNHHNRTHPLIKLKTPVRNMNISTESEDGRGHVRQMGDRHAAVATKSIATETVPVQHVNAATQVQTVAEIMPTEVKSISDAKPVEIKTIEVKKAEPVTIPVRKFVQPEIQPSLLNAHFVCDSVPDGQVFEPEARFTQIWTLKNPGPFAWPAGCSVRYVGGDNMLDVDNNHPASCEAIIEATESNVVAREVGVGEEIAFNMTLKAPKREGRSISYWRLKAADNTPFGHRLWCDIVVKRGEAVGSLPAADAQMAALRVKAAQLKHELRAGTDQLKQDTERLARAFAAPVPAPPQDAAIPALVPWDHAARSIPAPAPPAPQVALPYEQHEAMGLSTRLATMRAHQKARREAMLATWQTDVAKRNEQAGSSTLADTTAESLADKERREAVKQRVAHIKANILKSRMDRASLVEKFHQDKIAQTAAEKKTSEDAKVQKMIEAASKADVDDEEVVAEPEEEQLATSQMVFPKLDKESPASSTYQSMTSHSSKGRVAYVENEAGEIEHSAVPAAAAASAVEPTPSISSPIGEDEDEFESLDGEMEVLSAADQEDSEDDGFLTDEEYDILDASDSETVASK